MNRQNGRQAWRRALSVILSIAMAVGSVPATVLAEENATEPQEVATNGTDELDLVNEDAAAPEESFEDAVEDVVEDVAEDEPSNEVLLDDSDDAVVVQEEEGSAGTPSQQGDATSANTTVTPSEKTTTLPKRVNISGRAYVTGIGWKKEGAAPYIKLKGTGKGHVTRALRFNRANEGPSGSIVYRVRMSNDGWTKEGKDGAVVGATGKNQYVEAVKIRLTGKLKKHYNVWYRVNVAGSGWLDWTRNGKAAGTAGLKKSVRAIKVAIVKKGLPHPTGTSKYQVAYAKGDGIYNIGLKKVSGDVELDKMLVEFVKRYKIRSGKKGLWKAHDVIGRYGYAFEDINPQGNWKTWSIPMAKQMYRRGFGNCYRYAALMTWVARYLGYDAITVPGYHYNGSHHLVSHGWCEVRKNGKKYVIDPIFHGQHPEKNFFMVPYSKTPLVYYKHRV